MTFWTLILGGIIALIKGIVTGVFPPHATLGLTMTVLNMVNNSIGLVVTIALSNFDMTIPFTIFGILGVLEAVRTLYVTWLRIKHIFI